MKKVISISLALLVLFSGIRLDVAYHYCSGNLAGSRVSFSGKPASCGMEKPVEPKNTSDIIKRQCCEDLISTFSIYSQYLTPSANTAIDPGFIIITVITPTENTYSGSYHLAHTVPGKNMPPGSFNPAEVYQQVICTYRI